MASPVLLFQEVIFLLIVFFRIRERFHNLVSKKIIHYFSDECYFFQRLNKFLENQLSSVFLLRFLEVLSSERVRIFFILEARHGGSVHLFLNPGVPCSCPGFLLSCLAGWHHQCGIQYFGARCQKLGKTEVELTPRNI